LQADTASNEGLRSDTFSVVSGLQQLQRLDFRVGFQDPNLLLQLASLPALQHLGLVYLGAAGGSWIAVEHASVWGQLPQLRSLSLYLTDFTGRDLYVDEVDELAVNIGAATGLTKLTMSAHMDKPGPMFFLRLNLAPEQAAEAARSAAVCGSLAQLTNLQDLELWGPRLRPGDAMALTALTGLTRLFFREVGDGVGDAAAVALARSLTQLRCLELQAARSEGCVAAFAELTQLT
jgi:hypothetical protein